MGRRTTAIIAWGGFLLLVILHLDFWRPQRSVLLLGWIPEELAYRFVWVVLAWGYLLFVCSRVWREERS